MRPTKRVIQQGPLPTGVPNNVAAKASEQRWASRRQRNTPAHIVLNSEVLGARPAPIPCVLRDTSSTGARIELARTTAERWIGSSGSMPERFRLQIPSELVEVECAVAWCNDNMIGVRFVAPARVMKRQPRQKPEPQKKKKMISFGGLLSK
jgi:hypothetical protein